jgi:hypothetical protein
MTPVAARRYRHPMARIALVVIAAALLAAPSSASAAVTTIGSDLSATPTSLNCLGCTVSATSLPAPRLVAAPSPGVITRFEIKAGAAVSPVRLVVIRRPNGIGNNPGELAGRSAQVTPIANDVTPFDARIPIAAGEYIGLECCPGPADYLSQPGGTSTADVWVPTLDFGPPVLPSPTGLNLAAEPLVNAEVEPDIDRDGFGDDSQDSDDDGDGDQDTADNCPTAANPDQENADGDTLGDACDDDRDGDGVANAADVCPTVAGPAPRGCPVTPAPTINRPPTVRFRTPLAGTGIGPSFRIVLDVADDSGSPTVSVFDDDGTICTLRRAPYACTWTPTGADVGRATLLASAVDSAGLSTLGIVRVRVNRFEASLTQRQTHRKRTTRVRGRLVLPANVTRAQGCTGTVKIRLRKARRTATVTRRCTYSAKLPFRPGRARVRFSGNSVLAPT